MVRHCQFRSNCIGLKLAIPGEFALCIRTAVAIQVTIVHEAHRKPEGQGQGRGYRFSEQKRNWRSARIDPK